MNTVQTALLMVSVSLIVAGFTWMLATQYYYNRGCNSEADEPQGEEDEYDG